MRNFDLEKVFRIRRASTRHLNLDVSTNNTPIRVTPEEAIKIMDGPDDQDFIPCVYCKGRGFVPGIAKVDFVNLLNSQLGPVQCIDCDGTGKMK